VAGRNASPTDAYGSSNYPKDVENPSFIETLPFLSTRAVDKRSPFQKKSAAFTKLSIDRRSDICYDKIHRRVGNSSESRKDF
jgi:hypothetical protein